MMTKEVRTSRKGSVLTIMLDRSAKRNAFSKEMVSAIGETLAEARLDPEVRVVVLRGEGPHFSAGHDLLAHEAIAGKPRPWHEEDSRRYLEFLRDNLYMPIWDFPKPLVALVQGHAVAGGAELAFLADITVAEETAVFEYDILRVTGVVPSLVLPHIVGLKRALSLYMLGGRLDAQRAHEWGLVTAVAPVGELETKAASFVGLLAEIDPEVVKLNKQAVKFAFNLAGARNSLFYAHEADILVHLRAESGPEAELRYGTGINEVIRARRNRFRPYQIEL